MMASNEELELSELSPGRPTISIEYSAPEEIYYSGDIIEGFVIINNETEINITSITVRCMGSCNFNLAEGAEGSRQLIRPISNSETYFDIMETILENPEDSTQVITLEPGDHRYPFRFQMPREIPESFQAPCGSVSYSCKTIVNLPSASSPNPVNSSNYQFEKPFIVKAHLDINIVPNANTPVGFCNTKKLYRFMCLPVGSLKITIIANQKAFIVGNDIKLQIMIKNKTSKPLQLFEIYLRRITIFLDNATGSIYGHQGPPLVAVAIADCHQFGQTSVNEVILKVPTTTPPSRLGMGCNIMKVEYYIEIILCTSKIMTSATAIRLQMPIFIGTVSSIESVQVYRPELHGISPPPYTNIDSSESTTLPNIPLTQLPSTPPPAYDAMQFVFP